MAIELDNRTKILAGVVVLAAVGAGAWFFFLDDFLNEPPPKAAVAKSAPADASKQAEAAKPAADVPKQAAAANPGGKPIPANPDRLIAEVLANSGIGAQFLPFAREVVLQADTGGEPLGAAEIRAVTDIMDRVYEPGKMSEELAGNLKNNLDIERMGRFLELLRRPIATKMNSQDTRSASPEAVKEFLEKSRKSPPSPERLRLIQSLDDATRTSEVSLDMSSTIARSMVDTMLAELQKGKNVPKEARQMVAQQLNTMRDQARGLIRSVLLVAYRNVTDEELTEYLKLIDTDTGRWGNEALANAVRPVLAGRGSAFGAEAGKMAIARRNASAAKAPMANESVAKAEEQKSPEKVAAPSAPVPAPGYKRPDNIRDVYTRYNDVVSATVMRDQAAVKELLDDGKNPNARQKDGLTPLMIAAANGDAGIASMLLAKGADPNLRAGGRSALSMARGRANAGMVQLLERSGAKD